jgi:hypothetical protein
MKTKLSLLLIALSFAGMVQAQAQKKTYNQPLADSLAKLVAVDQIAAYIPTGEYKKLSREQWDRFKDSVFTNHQKIMENVFKRYGYPGFDLVGQKGSNHFWLMVQHCDKWPAFQQQILDAMKPEVLKKNADAKNFAYLTDRVNINTGKKQIYGTQMTYNTKLCQAIPRPLTDSANVNERRYEVGLEAIEEYQNSMSQMHFEMNKAGYEKRGITKPKLVAVPAKPTT